MIFSKFFKPTWQHKDSNVRIEAINTELSLNVDEHYNTLLDLAKNDESELVRRAALLKINSLSAWYEASHSNSLNNIKAFAEKQVEKILLGKHEISLTTKDKKQFVNEKLKASLLEEWLKVETDAEVVLALFKRVNKPQLLHSVFKQHQNEDIQLALVKQCNSSQGLEKLIKVSVNNTVKHAIEQILVEEQEKLEKPKRIQKAAQLTLSKYLAIKDVQDYASAIERKAKIVNEWQSLTQEFDWLEQEQKHALENRFDEIEQTVQKTLAPLAEAYEQEKIVKELAAKRHELLHSFKTSQLAIDQKITQAIFDNSPFDEEQTKQEIDQLIEKVQASVVEQSDKIKLVKKLNEVQEKLTKLPQVAEAVSAATHLISKMSQVSFPESVEQLEEKQSNYQRWKDEWRIVNKAASGVLPESIHNAYKEIKQRWDKALSPLIQEQKKQYHVTQRKIKDVSRLIGSGKYNAAFGVFKKAKHLYENLNPIQQDKLSREFQAISEKIAELSDWEHYIATPRKQEILKQIEDIAQSPLANPNEQANKVKSFRKLWNSLGHADDELERDLNEQFNQLSEKAFAPCRLYYAEQEKLRESHLEQRNKILVEAQTLAEQAISEQTDWKQYESHFNRLKHNWRDAGEVDRNAYRELNKSFKHILEPVKQAIDERHQQSISTKKQLISQAKELLNAEDLEQAVNDVKAFQVKWKEAGYSGPKHENPLWKEFRKINDELFTKRSEQFAASKALAQQAEETVSKQISEITKPLDNKSLESVRQVTRNLEGLQTQFRQEGISAKTLDKLFKSEFDKLTKLEQKLSAKALKENWKLVFEALHFMVDNEVSEFAQLTEISPAWQKRLLDIDGQAPAKLDTRTDKTLLLEILASKESPENEQKRRLELQLTLIQEQMNSGQLNSIEQGLIDWLSVGGIQQQDKPLIERARSVFIK